LDRRLDGPQNQSGCGKEKKSSPSAVELVASRYAGSRVRLKEILNGCNLTLGLTLKLNIEEKF
jgi:hypothetical protein